MGQPQFKTAEIFSKTRDFGRDQFVQPGPVTSLNEQERAWAWYQHRAALAVRRALAQTGRSVEDRALDLGEDLAWLTRKLNGQAPADLGEILGWARRLGAEVVPNFELIKDLGL